MVGVLLLADCDPPSTAERLHVLLFLALALLTALAIAGAVLRPREERGRLAATYLGAAIAGGLICGLRGGLDSDAAIGARFAIALAVGGAGGLGVSALRRRRPVRYVVAGLLGGATFWTGLLALLVGALAVTGGCLD
jgi:hypothetical protein